MYTKAVRHVPGVGNLPLLFITVSLNDQTKGALQLAQLPPYGAEDFGEPAGTVDLSTGLEISINGVTVLRDDSDPAPPEGWAEAVVRAGSEVLVVFLPTQFDLRADQLFERLEAWKGSDLTAQVSLPVTGLRMK